jgi:hypothetical protein
MIIHILFDTNKFNLSEVKPDFINDCCFGEDFANWLGQELNLINIITTEPFQEDWGWAFYIKYKRHNYFIGVGGNADDLNKESNLGEWRVMVEKKRSIIEKILGKNKLNKDDDIINFIHTIIMKQNDFHNIRIEV